MDMSRLSQGWKEALGQFVDIESPFGRARAVVTLILVLLAVLVGLAAEDDRRPGLQSRLEALIGCGLAMIIGFNTFSALTGTISQLMTAVTGRPFGGRETIDLLLATVTLLFCLLVWGLLGLGLVGLFRGLGRRAARLMGEDRAGPAA